MYRVTVLTDGKEYLLHDPRDDEIQLISADLIEEIGKHQTFNFSLARNHPSKDKIIPMASEIMLWEDKKLLTCCRMLNSQSDFYDTGQATCESESGYLLDSIQRPYEFSGPARDLFVQLLNAHNTQVEERKRIEPGNLDVTADIIRSNTEYSSTLSEILTNFCNDTSCYFHLRYADGKKYLDCVRDYGGINTQVIQFGENLTNLTKHMDAASLITVLIPTGDDVDLPDGSGNQKAVDITSVNGGRDYITHDAAVQKFGMLWGTKKFDGITDPAVLLAKAKVYLDDTVELPETIELNAVDLSLIDKDIKSMKVGYWTNVESKPHGVKRRMMLSKKTFSLTDPAKCSIVLGSVRPTFTGEVAKSESETSSRIDRVAASSSKEINRKVENATQLITGARGGYVVLDVDDPDTGKRSLPWRILIMDAPEKEDAVSVIQINKNGIGFSTTGINGPYRNAWTIDGNLVADFITVGTLLADRVRGGTLEVGGSGLGRDGRIVVKDSSDNQIGYWDNTGLHILKGVIKGTDFIGGTINIGDGTFEVDRNGAVTIESGEINIGNTRITPGYAWIGDFGVSSGSGGLFYSRDSGTTIQMSSSLKNDWLTLGLTVQHGSAKTSYTAAGVNTNGDISFDDPWTENMTALEMFKDLYKKIRELKS